MACFWNFAWTKQFVFFFCMEGSFFRLPQDGMTVDVDIRDKWQMTGDLLSDRPPLILVILGHKPKPKPSSDPAGLWEGSCK